MKQYVAGILSLSFFIAHCSASVFSLSYSTFYGDREIELYLGADNHSLGSKAQNFAQLQYFFKNVLAQDSFHLIAESKFFHGLHAYAENKDFSNILSNQIPFQLPQDLQWSVSTSPQKQSATTWIAWELPFLLMQLKNKNICPSSLDLSDAEINHIIHKISFEFWDPRVVSAKAILALQGKIIQDQGNIYNVIEVMRDVYNKFFDALKRLPEINADRLAQEVTQLNLVGVIESLELLLKGDWMNDDKIESFLATDPFEQFFDLQVLTSIINVVYRQNTNNKKIVVLAGYRHVARLESLVKFIGFNQHQTATISENGNCLGRDLMKSSSVLPEEWANKLCRLLGFITLSKAPKPVIRPRIKPQINCEQNSSGLPIRRSLLAEFNDEEKVDLSLSDDQSGNSNASSSEQPEKMQLDLP